MEVMPLMSWAKGEESHQQYKEEYFNHCDHVLDYYIDMVWYLFDE